jgi:hypothetical protein
VRIGHAGISIGYLVNKFCTHPVKPVYFFAHRMLEAVNGGALAFVTEQQHV